MEQIIPFVLALACGLVQGEWRVPDSIPIPCGEGGKHMRHMDRILPLRDVYEMQHRCLQSAINSGKQASAVLLFCEKVKKRMQMKDLEITTSSALQTSTTDIPTKAPAEHVIPVEACSSPDLQIETVVMVIIPIVCYISGIATLAIYWKCCRKSHGNRLEGPNESERGVLLKETGVPGENPRCRADNLNSHPPQGSFSGTTDPQGATKLAISAQ